VDLWKGMHNMEDNYNRFNNFEFGKLYALWLREFKVFLREKSRLIAAIFTPLLWLFVFGGGLGSSLSGFSNNSNINYQEFIFPGIISMSVIFSSVFFGSYIIWDKKFDFLKSVMVAPVNRSTIFIGKTLGGMTTSIIQAFILLLVGLFLGVSYTPESLVLITAIILLLSFALTSLGLAIGSFMESLEGFQLIVSFVVFPLYFLSGALFPLKNIPSWLVILTSIDPATYAVEALRTVMLNIPGKNPFALNFVLLVISTIILGIIGITCFKKMKAI
jgi:ABC-2 type transport system permease protein